VDAYQRSKLAAEQLVLAANQPAGLQTVVLRPGAFYGPGGRYGFNRLFIEEPLRGLRIQVDGGRRITFFVYVPDVARAVGLALVSGRAGEIYNICDDACSHRQINTLVSQIAGISAWRLNAPRRLMVSLARLMEAWAALTRQEPFYPLNLEHYVFQDWPASNAKARRELGFTPTPLAEGLRATIDWYRRPLR
jgi:nucleoside-diphosphate-sugar epimerase